MKSPESHGRPVDRTGEILRLDIHVTLLATLHPLGPDPTTWPDRALSPAFALYTLTALSAAPVAAAALRAAGAVAVLAPLLLQTEANEAVSAALSLALLAGKVRLSLSSSFSPSRRRSLTTHPLHPSPSHVQGRGVPCAFPRNRNSSTIISYSSSVRPRGAAGGVPAPHRHAAGPIGGTGR